MFKKALNFFVLVSFVACSSATTIRSTEKDASIFVDGEYKGKGEIVHEDQKIVGSSTYVEIRKDGCESVKHTIQKNEEANVGAIVGGIFFFFPFLWVMKYKPEHSYEFSCKKQLTVSNP